MALPPPKHSEMGAFYLVLRPMELSAEFGYTTSPRCTMGSRWRRACRAGVSHHGRVALPYTIPPPVPPRHSYGAFTSSSRALSCSARWVGCSDQRCFKLLIHASCRLDGCVPMVTGSVGWA